jgi:hypothetical protein
MRRLYLLLVLISVWAGRLQALTIAVQDFELTPATPTLTFTESGGTIYTGSTTINGRPASTPFAFSGTRGYGLSNGTATINFPQSGGINLCTYENISLNFRLAAFSLTTGNGMEAIDTIRVDISTDGGTTWITQVVVRGSTSDNAWWSYSGGTGIASRNYSVSTQTVFQAVGAGEQTANGFSTVQVNNLPPVSDLRIRIVLRNDNNNERWVIDDVTLSGDPVSATGLSICPPDPIANLNYLLGTGPSAARPFVITGNGLSPTNGTVTLSAPANFQIAASAAGPYSSSLSFNYTGGSFSPATYFVRLAGGLTLDNYSGNISINNGGPAVTLPVFGTVTQDLFFSEYVESNINKYIEIYNPTGNTINLSDYRVQLFSNGASNATSTYNLPSFSLAPCSVFTIRNTGGTFPADVVNTVTSFNGNDAILLLKISTGDTLDIFGRIGSDPGTEWTAPGGFATYRKTLVRRPEVLRGVGSNPGTGFPTLGTEWIQYNINEGRLLGQHSSISCGTAIETLPLSTTGPYCPGDILPIAFNAFGNFNVGNQFRVELSDASGLFGSPTLLSGSLALSGDNPSGTVNAIIPSVASTSNEYRVRVTSTHPISQTIINPPGGFSLTAAAGLEDVSNLSFSNVSGEVTLSWTNPSGCFDEILIIVTSSEGITFSPSGNGSAYTPNTVFGGFNQTVYKGTGTTATISNLTDGQVYFFEVFTRQGSNWSGGIEIGAIPDRYCIPSISNSCDQYIYNLQLNTINNSSPEGCGFRGYSSFINQSTTLVKGETYTLNVGVGTVGQGTNISVPGNDIRAWIDYNQDGTLANTVTERIINQNDNGAAGSYSFTVPLTAASGTTRLRVRILLNNEISPCGATSIGETEDYTITIIDPCTPNATTSSFFPTSGPEGTEVRITGTNLNLVTAVQFNGVPASNYTIVNATTILAIVPEGAGTGRISILDDVACRSTSSGTFTTLIPNNNCGGAYTDLFISEVYDPLSGNNHYVEIYNGTGAEINLNTPASYAIQVANRNTEGGTITLTTVNITGVIPNGETRVYYLGANGLGLTTGTQSSAGTGYNLFDDVRLLKNSSIIDLYYTGNTEGFVARRNNNVPAPSTVFTATDWSITPGGNTSDLNNYVPLDAFNITAHPMDISGCEISMTATGSIIGLSYQWRYNNNRGNNTTWTDLANGPGIGPFSGAVISGANGPTLQITGNLSSVDQYQFYCEVSLTTCFKPSNAAQFTLNPGRYWRTIGSGDWTDVSKWETAAAGTGPWSAACAFPTLANADSVVIRNNDSLFINSGVSVGAGQLHINTGSKLRLETTGRIDIGDRPGADFFVMGTFEDNSSGGNGLFLNSSSTWILGANGELIKAGGSSAIKYREQYEGGIINIPATATWRYRRISNTNPGVLSGTVGFGTMYYPNLYFENYTGTAYTQTVSTSFQGNSLCVIKGNLSIGIEGGNTVTARSSVANNALLQINGDLIIGAGSSFSNVDGANIGSGFDVKGNLNINGTLTTNALTSSVGRLRLSGSGTQTISGSGTINLDSLSIDKAAQSLVILNRDLLVNRQILFGTGGIIQTGSNTLSISNGDVAGAIVGAPVANPTGIYNNDRYVIGNLARRIANGSTDTYTFPVGDFPPPLGIGYNPLRVEMTGIPNNSTLTGKFAVGSPGLLNVFRRVPCEGFDRIVNHIGFTGLGYWQVDGPPTTNYNIWLHPNIENINTNPNFDIVDFGFVNNYRALKEDNSRLGLPWDEAVVSAGDPCVVSTNYYQIPGFGYTGFSIFAPGGGGTALPVELLSFTASCEGESVRLNWQTASELNSDFFTIERSYDGRSFEAIGFIPAAGNSDLLLNYSFLDRGHGGKFSYYRLIETDFDGQTYASSIISSECSNETDRLQIYYAPGDGVMANIYNGSATSYRFHIFDAAGRELYSTVRQAGSGPERQVILRSDLLPKGMYFVAAFFDQKVVSSKIVVY